MSIQIERFAASDLSPKVTNSDATFRTSTHIAASDKSGNVFFHFSTGDERVSEWRITIPFEDLHQAHNLAIRRLVEG